MRVFFTVESGALGTAQWILPSAPGLEPTQSRTDGGDVGLQAWTSGSPGLWEAAQKSRSKIQAGQGAFPPSSRLALPTQGSKRTDRRPPSHVRVCRVPGRVRPSGAWRPSRSEFRGARRWW